MAPILRLRIPGYEDEEQRQDSWIDAPATLAFPFPKPHSKVKLSIDDTEDGISAVNTVLAVNSQTTTESSRG